VYFSMMLSHIVSWAWRVTTSLLKYTRPPHIYWLHIVGILGCRPVGLLSFQVSWKSVSWLKRWTHTHTHTQTQCDEFVRIYISSSSGIKTGWKKMISLEINRIQAFCKCSITRVVYWSWHCDQSVRIATACL
jgi:hypothetical protein